MGFRKTHRRTKKRGGTRQRGGSEAAQPTKAQLEEALGKAKADFDELATDEEKKDLSNQVVINFIDAFKKANNYNITPDAEGNAPTEKIDLSSARTGLPENLVQALEVATRAADDATEVAKVELFEGDQKKKFIENLTKVFTEIFTKGAESGADLSVVV